MLVTVPREEIGQNLFLGPVQVKLMAAVISYLVFQRSLNLTLAMPCHHCNSPEVWPQLSALEVSVTKYFLFHFPEIPSKLAKQNHQIHVTQVLKRPSGLPSASTGLKAHFILMAVTMWKTQSTSLEVFPQQHKQKRNNSSALGCLFNLFITPQGPWDCSLAKNEWRSQHTLSLPSWKSLPFVPQSHWVAGVSFFPSPFDDPQEQKRCAFSFPFFLVKTHICPVFWFSKITFIHAVTLMPTRTETGLLNRKHESEGISEIKKSLHNFY